MINHKPCLKCGCSCLVSTSCPTLFANPWTVARQAPLSKGFSRQEYWSGLPYPYLGEIPNSEMNPGMELISCIDRQILYHWANREAVHAVTKFQISKIQSSSENFLHNSFLIPFSAGLFLPLVSISLLRIPILSPTSCGIPHSPPCPTPPRSLERFNKKCTKLRDRRSWNGIPVCLLLGTLLPSLSISFLTHKTRIKAQVSQGGCLDWKR